MIYFTSDLHLGHNKDFLYKSRGFNSIEEHDAAIIANINDTINYGDTLYILGDLMLQDNHNGKIWLSQINCCDIRYIRGNHDGISKEDIYNELNMICEGYASMVKYGKRKFIISHFPMIIGNSDTHRINLCGHTHTKNRFIDMASGVYHVELDAHNNRPISIDNIVKDINYYNSLDSEKREQLIKTGENYAII